MSYFPEAIYYTQEMSVQALGEIETVQLGLLSSGLVSK